MNAYIAESSPVIEHPKAIVTDYDRTDAIEVSAFELRRDQRLHRAIGEIGDGELGDRLRRRQ